MFEKTANFGRLEDQIDKKVDVFAYAMTMFWVITGQKPWDGMLSNEIETQVVKGVRPTFPEAPTFSEPKLISIVKRCWDHNPHLRPSFDSLVDDLRDSH